MKNPAYRKVQKALTRARERGDRVEARSLRQQLRGMPSKDPHDPGYRRLRYCRYADDHLLGFTGPKAEAEEIKQRLGRFLRDELRLELSEAKTLITHARTSAARFLGYEITVQHNDKAITNGQRSSNATVRLRVPVEVIKAKCASYTQRGKPARRTRLMNMDDYTIVSIYGAEYRGLIQYYLLASDVYRLNRLNWVMETSMLKTLAGKHRSTVSKTAAKYKAKVDTPYGPRTCFEATVERAGGRQPLVARYGGIPLRGRRRPSCKTVTQVERSVPRSWSPDSLRIDVRSASTREICKCTTSESSPTSTSWAKRIDRCGQQLWRNGAVSPSWSAKIVMTISMPDSQSRTHGVVTGEPDAFNGARPVRRGGPPLPGVQPN